MNYFDEGRVLLFNKPATWTSFDLVKKVRNLCRTKRVGHAGTLDPLATGLLIICTGPKTKEIQYIQAAEKEYSSASGNYNETRKLLLFFFNLTPAKIGTRSYKTFIQSIF